MRGVYLARTVNSNNYAGELLIPEEEVVYSATIGTGFFGSYSNSTTFTKFHGLNSLGDKIQEVWESAARGIASQKDGGVHIRKNVEVSKDYLEKIDVALECPEHIGLIGLIAANDLESVFVDLTYYRDMGVTPEDFIDEKNGWNPFDAYWEIEGDSEFFNFHVRDDEVFTVPDHRQLHGYFIAMGETIFHFSKEEAIAIALMKLTESRERAISPAREMGVNVRSIDEAMEPFFEFLSSNYNALDQKNLFLMRLAAKQVEA
jgi:hypothetical protein